MKFIDDYFKKFRKQPKSVICLLVFVKFLFGVGLGAALAAFFWQYDWWTTGIAIIIIALLLHIPIIYKVLGKEKKKRKK